MKKMLILMAALLVLAPICDAREADPERVSGLETIKPRKAKKATFKSRRVVLKGPKAKNRKQWKDPAPSRNIRFLERADAEFGKRKKSSLK